MTSRAYLFQTASGYQPGAVIYLSKNAVMLALSPSRNRSVLAWAPDKTCGEQCFINLFSALSDFLFFCVFGRRRFFLVISFYESENFIYRSTVHWAECKQSVYIWLGLTSFPRDYSLLLPVYLLSRFFLCYASFIRILFKTAAISSLVISNSYSIFYRTTYRK